jgi:hypothetical protein
VSGFDARWRTLARRARRAAEPPLGTPPLGLARPAVEALGAPYTAMWWRPWLGPVAAMAVLYVLALPLVDGALAATASLRVSLSDVPRPPSLPSPPLPHAPLLPKPPSVPRTTEALELLVGAPFGSRLESFLALKEARP